MDPRIITDLNDPEFTRHFTEFKYTAWRLETLQNYAVPYEASGFAYFKEHGRLNDDAKAAMQEWVDTVITPAVKAGKKIGRVHVVEQMWLPDDTPDSPTFTSYIDFEMKEYAISKAAGEDVNMLFTLVGKWPEGVWGRGHDFWLFDSSTMIEMHYDDDFAFRQALVHTEASNPTAIVRACMCRDAAMNQAKPFYP